MDCIPDARLRSLLIAVAAVMACPALPAAAQFAGGVGDGFGLCGQTFVPLNGGTLPAVVYSTTAPGGDGYAGAGIAFVALAPVSSATAVFTATASGGDGYSGSGLAFAALSGSAVPAVVYAASPTGGDGYAGGGLANLSLSGAPGYLSAYSGGTGDGYDVTEMPPRVIDPAAVSFALYNGGSGDGYDEAGVLYSPVGGGVEASVLYTASVAGGDGYDTRGIQFQPVTPGDFPVAVFTASATGGDGYDSLSAQFISMDGGSLPAELFAGTESDGYAGDGLRHSPLSSPLNGPDVLFAGSPGDGYDVKSLPFVQYLGGEGAAAGITFAGWRFSRFTEGEIASGLAEATADADADGLANVVEFAIGSDPRVADASVFGPQFRLSNLSDLGFAALPQRHLTGVVVRNQLALDASLEFEVTSDVAAGWSTDDIIVVDSAPSALIVRDALSVGDAPVRSMRLRATLNQ